MDLMALRHQCIGTSPADAAASTGDEHDFAFGSIHFGYAPRHPAICFILAQE